MESLGHFMHAWLIFISSLMYLEYKPRLKKQVLFTVFYGLGIIFFRRIYEFLPVPFGTHMILLIMWNAILLNVIVKEISWIKATVISLIVFTVLLINDLIIFMPLMKYLDLTVDSIIGANLMRYIILWIASNFLLIVAYITGIMRNQKRQSYNL